MRLLTRVERQAELLKQKSPWLALQLRCRRGSPTLTGPPESGEDQFQASLLGEGIRDHLGSPYVPIDIGT